MQLGRAVSAPLSRGWLKRAAERIHLKRGGTMKGQSVAVKHEPKSGHQAPQFLVHQDGDSVGVIVLEDIKAGQDLTGWVMAEDRTIQVKVLNDIPIGHKVALKDFAVGDSIIKYGVNIGKVVVPIKKGEHVHVQNLKTRKW
jgi:(2R)-sulfolactate sulfo-lyase subunit alpha